MGNPQKRERDLGKAFPAWSVSITKGGHLKLTHKSSGRSLFTSRTPSDWRADKNLASQVRRMEQQYGGQ